MRGIDRNSHFSRDFFGKNKVRGIHECAVYTGKYGIHVHYAFKLRNLKLHGNVPLSITSFQMNALQQTFTSNTITDIDEKIGFFGP